MIMKLALKAVLIYGLALFFGALATAQTTDSLPSDKGDALK